VGRTLLESRQMPEGWWIVTVPFLRFWKRFAVVTPYGLERRRFLRLDSAEEFARQRHAAGETGAVALGRFASRPRPPRRVRSLGAGMVGTETDRRSMSSRLQKACSWRSLTSSQRPRLTPRSAGKLIGHGVPKGISPGSGGCCPGD
jgi:hypothetical protein